MYRNIKKEDLNDDLVGKTLYIEDVDNLLHPISNNAEFKVSKVGNHDGKANGLINDNNDNSITYNSLLIKL